MFIKKTAIFCGEKERRGIITLIFEDGIGTLSAKLYNTKPNDKLIVKFTDGTNLIFDKLTPIMSRKVNKKEDFCCAIFDDKILGKGKTNGYQNSEIALNDLEAKQENKEIDKGNEIYDKLKEDAFEGEVASVNYYQNDLPKEISMDASKIIENSKEKESCDILEEGKESLSRHSEEKSSNKPKKVDNDMKENIGEENAKRISDIDREDYKPSFYNEIKPQLDSLFSKFPPDEYLNSIIPSSKWVMVDYDNEGKSYSVGILTDGEDVLFIGYGILSTYGETPIKKN